MNEDLPDVDEEVEGAIKLSLSILKMIRTVCHSLISWTELENPEASDDLYNYVLRHPETAISLVNELEEYFDHPTPDLDTLRNGQENFQIMIRGGKYQRQMQPKFVQKRDQTIMVIMQSTLRKAQSILIVTSPPYWQKRDYGIEEQLGQESDVQAYIDNIIEAMDHWKTFLRPTGSVFINIGDSYHNKSLQGIPGRFASAALENNWSIRNEIRWAKDNGIPSSAQDRLVPRHEVIYHLVLDKDNYFYDLHGYPSCMETVQTR